MRRFTAMLLALTFALCPFATGAVSATEAELREEVSPSVRRVLLDLLRTVFGFSGSDGSPEADPNGILGVPSGSGGSAAGSPGMDPDGHQAPSGGGSADGSPEADPNG